MVFGFLTSFAVNMIPIGFTAATLVYSLMKGGTMLNGVRSGASLECSQRGVLLGHRHDAGMRSGSGGC